MKTIEVGVIHRPEYSENNGDLRNAKEEIIKHKVKGTIHGIYGFWRKYFFVGYLDTDGKIYYTFLCKLTDFKYMK